MITHQTIWGALKDKANNDVFDICGSGVPTDGTSGTGVNVAGPGSIYYDYTNAVRYLNVGTKASPVWSACNGGGAFLQARGTITAAEIIATTAGGLGHANGYPMVAAPDATYCIELISVVCHFTFGVAAYTAGGNITVNWSGGSGALTGLVSAANSLGAAASSSWMFWPLDTVAVQSISATGINLVSSAAFTNPGTATGTIAYVVNFRKHLAGF